MGPPLPNLRTSAPIQRRSRAWHAGVKLPDIHRSLWSRLAKPLIPRIADNEP